ncbi:MAG TPA: glycosyltransferase [Gemmatimonadaceae bacterium]|jgi:GT2 family glycosyltransferase|nr:glycosyltransferase [Gemmatimonadaceae bacterium]
MPRIVIGVPTYNGAERLGWLLKSMAMRTPMLATGDVRIVVVDDGSPMVGATVSAYRMWEAQLPIDLVQHGGNRGISAGWNTAARHHDCEYVVPINDDVIVPSGGWLESLIHTLEHSPGVGVVGASWHAFTPEDAPALLAGPESDRDVIPREPRNEHGLVRQNAARRTQYEDVWPGRVMCPTGELFAFRRKDFDRIGGFDENYKSFYEESDFGTSMAAAGLIGVQLTWPFCYHLWSATFGASPELRADERMTASRAYYRRKWAVPDGVAEFDFTNPKFFGAIGDVPVEFLRKSGPCKGVLRQDGAFVEGV